MSYERPYKEKEVTTDAATFLTESPVSELGIAIVDGSVPSLRNVPNKAKRFKVPLPPFYLTSFVLFVVLPSVISIIYLVFIASDQYVASARFAVKSTQDEGPGLNDLMSGGLGQLNLAGQDSHVIVEYIRSRAIIDDLKPFIDVKQIFSRPEADFWARLKRVPSVEQLTDYWYEMVTTSVDAPSGIVTVNVRAFRRQDALDLTKAVLNASERLVNDVSLKARRDAMSRAENEVRRSEAMVQRALEDMRQFRDKVGFIDPMASATMFSRLITEAVSEKIKLENELFVATRAMSANAPAVSSLNIRLLAVNEQIDKLKATMTSSSKADAPLSSALVSFEELELKRIFAEKLYTLAQDALERARVKAERQNIFMIVFVPPSLPEEARFPERLSMSLIIPMSLLVLWGIGAMLAATIEDHRN